MLGCLFTLSCIWRLFTAVLLSFLPFNTFGSVCHWIQEKPPDQSCVTSYRFMVLLSADLLCFHCGYLDTSSIQGKDNFQHSFLWHFTSKASLALTYLTYLADLPLWLWQLWNGGIIATGVMGVPGKSGSVNGKIIICDLMDPLFFLCFFFILINVFTTAWCPHIRESASWRCNVED